MSDPTEGIRRTLVAQINTDDNITVENLRAAGTECWSTQELQRDFEVLGFLAPFCRVRRKSDGARGLVEFRHSPRVYFNFAPE